jgi:acyl-CoA synthetase (AMP-forming)/AMP-acid ligase II
MNSNEPELKHLLHSAGKPYAGVAIKIVDEANTTLPANAIGEVSIKGNVVAMGYKNQAVINDKIFGNDGWFCTGDMGYVDENGYLFLVDRKNDMIISKGQNIYPAEIEQIIIQHPVIKDVAIIGVPHEVYGEAICAIVVVKKDTIQLNELRNWAKDKMPEYKLPAAIEIVEELPRNPTGKVLRKLLREKYWTNKQRRIN